MNTPQALSMALMLMLGLTLMVCGADLLGILSVIAGMCIGWPYRWRT
jgi:hypothetical protein